MPYPDNFSGARFDAHYGTQDEEPEEEHLISMPRWAASAAIEKAKAMGKSAEVEFFGADGHSIVSLTVEPDGKFALVAEHHHNGGKRMDIVTCVLSPRVLHKFLEQCWQLLAENGPMDFHPADPADHADLIVNDLRTAQRVSVADVDAAWTANMGHILHLSDADRLRCVIAWIDASIKAGMEGK